MLIEDIPIEFQTPHVPTSEPYPPYSDGIPIEETLFYKLKKEKNNIKTTMVYLPIFWTSYYIKNKYGSDIDPLLDFLENLDKSKNYFTIVQFASGIFIKNIMPNLFVFSAGGGGQNIKSECIYSFFNKRDIQVNMFKGNIGDCIIPLICNQDFPNYNLEKRHCFCSLIANFNTHDCRYQLQEEFSKHGTNKKNFNFSFPYGDVSEYIDMANNSLFTLAPRGYGYTSFRLYEAILAGSIPIYVWEDKIILPYQDRLDWGEFCIIIHTSLISSLNHIIDNCDIPKMQAKLKEVRHFFSMDYLEEYMKEVLSNK